MNFLPDGFFSYTSGQCIKLYICLYPKNRKCVDNFSFYEKHGCKEHAFFFISLSKNSPLKLKKVKYKISIFLTLLENLIKQAYGNM